MADAAAKPRRGSTARRGPTHAQIAERAYYIHLREPGGSDVDHWLRAEEELRSARTKR